MAVILRLRYTNIQVMKVETKRRNYCDKSHNYWTVKMCPVQCERRIKCQNSVNMGVCSVLVLSVYYKCLRQY